MRIYFLILFFSISYHVSFSQQNVKSEVLIEKLRTVRSAIELIDSKDEEVIQKRNNLRLLINDINIRLDVFDGTFPKQYLEALTDELKISKEISSKTKTEQISSLDFLYKDLSIKFKDRANTLKSQLYNDYIKVKVESSRNGITTKGLRVRYASKGYPFNPNKQQGMFGVLTSPAIENLIPGYYWIWITKDGDLTVLRKWDGELSPEKDNYIQFDIP